MAPIFPQGLHIEVNGPDYSWQLRCLQTGMDLAQRETSRGCDRVGVFFGAGTLGSNVNPLGAGATGRINMDAYSFGGYWTVLDRSGWYVDAITQGTYYTTTANTGLDNYRTNGFGVATSLETGVPIPIGRGLWLEPQLQLIYQHVSFNDVLDSTALINFDPTDALRGRIGARLVQPWTTGSFWIRGNIWHEFIGQTSVTLAGITGQNGVNFQTPFTDTWAEVGFGINGDIYQMSRYLRPALISTT